MSHAVFQTAQIMPINTQFPIKPKGLPSLPKPKPKLAGPTQPVVRKIWRGVAVSMLVRVLASSSSSTMEGEDSMALLERCFVAPLALGSSGPIMKGGKFGAVTLKNPSSIYLRSSLIARLVGVFE